jgi:hypothetical protein
VQEVAAKAGYEMLFAVNGEKLTCDTPSNALGRYMIVSNQPKIFASAVTFDRGGSAGSAASVISAQALDPAPADGAIVENEKPLIRASLATLGAIEADSVNMRLSGVGLLPAKFDADDKIVSCQPPKPLASDHYTVIVSAKADGRKFEGRWSFTVNPANQPALAKGPALR